MRQLALEHHKCHPFNTPSNIPRIETFDRSLGNDLHRPFNTPSNIPRIETHIYCRKISENIVF